MKKFWILLTALVVVCAFSLAEAGIDPSSFTLIKEGISNESPKVDLIDLSSFQKDLFQYALLVDFTGREMVILDAGFDSDAAAVQSVPEPGIVLLLGVSLIGLFVVGQRQVRN